MTTHARLLDRRRFLLALGEEGAEGVLAALDAYRNPDGGFGWGLEPDLRSASSQPVGAFEAFEVFEEITPATSPRAAELCDWLQAAALPDGGLPFSMAGAAGPGTAPFWAAGDPTSSSLHITSAVCAGAHRVAAHDTAVAAHPWLEAATQYCRAALRSLQEPGGAHELRFVLGFLDAYPGAEAELERVAAFLPESGELAVKGGVEGEKLRPLDIAPLPDRPLREFIAADVIERDLDRLESEQHDDGGWHVDFNVSSPAAKLEWRGYTTVHAVRLLRANGRL